MANALYSHFTFFSSSFGHDIHLWCLEVDKHKFSLHRYDREEGNTMFDTDSSSFFLGDDASFQKKEAELAKRLVCFMPVNFILCFWVLMCISGYTLCHLLLDVYEKLMTILCFEVEYLHISAATFFPLSRTSRLDCRIPRDQGPTSMLLSA